MAEQLWGKGAPLDQRIHRFTVGNDPQTDLALLPYDLLGTAAHVRMLAHVGLMSREDSAAVIAELAKLLERARAGKLTITPEQEDCHTAIEHALTAALGEAGKNVHLGRSRNDQVLLALRLYMRDAVFALAEKTGAVAYAFLDCASAYADAPMPGYTHLRRAMPSSGGIWAAAYAEALVEELQALDAVYRRLDRCPLGSGAGFGVPLPIDREHVAGSLGFSGVQRSVLDVQNSRGRHELALAGWIAGAASGLEKFLWDVALFSTEEFGFITLPDEFTTGSSIMPQKRNPDVVELARGRCAQLRAWRGELEQVASALPGSYHRDFQLLKAPLLRSVNGMTELLDVLALLIPRLILNRERCAAACTPELYATQEAYRRVLTGALSFRDAYREVGREVLAGTFAPELQGDVPQHTGSAERLGLEETRRELDALLQAFAEKQAAVQQKYDALLS